MSKTSRTISECEADTRIHEVEDLVEDPEEISQLLRAWMRNLGNLHCDSVLDMWAEQGLPDKELFVATDPYHGLQWDVRDEWGVEEWEGPVDARGRWHGRGVVRLAGGGEVAGTWKLGRREGRFSTTAPADGILSLVGGYRDGKLTGMVRIIRWVWIYCTPRNHVGTIAAGKIKRNIKFAAFWCVLLTKKKVYPESWCNKLSIKQPSKKKIPKDNFT